MQANVESVCEISRRKCFVTAGQTQ